MKRSNGRPLILIDSSAWIASLSPKGDATARDAVDECLAREVATTTGMIIIEVLRGCRTRKAFVELEARLGLVQRLPVSEFVWQEAARLGFELRKHGVTVPSTDLLIATVAIIHGCTLLHRDRHFEDISQHTPLKSRALS